VDEIGPAIFIKALRVMKADDAKAKFGARVISIINGIERNSHTAILLTLPNLFDNAGAASVPMPRVILLREEMRPICSSEAENFRLKNRLKSGTINPAPKPIIAVGIINLSIVL